MRRWFDRQFDFDLPVALFPNLVVRLSGTPARAEDMIRSMPPAILTRREGERWSIQENLGHLLDLEPLWLGRVEDILRGKARLRDADLTNRATHEAQHNTKSIEDILRRFRMARKQLVERVEGLDEDVLEAAALHPRLEQPMRVVDLVYFVAEHDDHHLARVRTLWRTFEEGEGDGGNAA